MLVHFATVSGWTALLAVFRAQFDDRPESDMPLLKVVILSDGKFSDNPLFRAAMRSLPSGVSVVVAVVGCEYNCFPFNRCK